jgi:PAS domain S-box-containing protein
MKQTNRFKKLMAASSQYEDAIDKLWTCIQERRYSALLGPHYAGKSRILEHLLNRVKKEPVHIGIKVDLSRVIMAANTQFLIQLADLIGKDLTRQTGIAAGLVSPGIVTGGDFRAFIESLLLRTKRNIVLVLDHLESLPRDILHHLLVSLRAQFMAQQSQPYHLVVLVSGALSLADQATGEISPFYNIVTRVTLRELSRAESSRLVDIELDGHRAKISDKARELFLDHAQGDSFLIQELIRKCLSPARGRLASHLTVSTVKRVVEEFSGADNQDYALFKEAVHLIEDDPDLLQCILILLERGMVSRLSLPLQSSPDIDPLDLTSLVRKSGSNEYTIRNEIYRQFLSRKFNPGRSGNLFMTHGRWDMAIYYLEKSLLSGERAYASNFLETTLNAMYSADSLVQAASHFLNGLRVGFGVQKARLWMKASDKELLRQVDGIGFEGQISAGEISLRENRLEGRAFLEKMPLREQDEDRLTHMAFPLASAVNNPRGLITIYDFSPVDRDWELQLYSYLNRGARALFETEVRQRQKQQIHNQDLQIQRKAELLYLLYRVSTLIQTMTDLGKALRLVLTTVTAHFGLQFNRAWIFMVNESKTFLEGACAIGELTEADAYRTWGQVGSRTADELIDGLLHSDAQSTVPIDRIVKDLSLPIDSPLEDPFRHVLTGHQPLRWMSSLPKHGELPVDFQRQFDVQDAWITPLLADRECLGLLIVDNKFNNRPLELADTELLSTFANLAAMAIAQDRRRSAEQSRLEISETFREISRILSGSLDIVQVLDSVLEQMARVLPYRTASVQWLDEDKKNLKIIRARGFADEKKIETLSFALDRHFPNAEVFHKKEVVRYEDVQKVYDHFSDPKYGVKDVRSWLGAPLIVEDDVKGVITVDHFEPGVYTADHEIIAITLASQAALAIENARSYEEQFTQTRYLDDLIGSSLDGVIAVDTQGYITKYNERAQRICGYSREEVIDGHMHVKVLYGGLKTPVEIQRLLESQQTLRDYETTIVAKSGRKIPILLSASQITADSGEVLGSVGFFEDQRQRQVARNINEYLVQLQAHSLRHVLDGLAKWIHALIGADSVVIYPYNALTKAYDSDNIGRFGLLHKSKKFSPKVRTAESQTRRLFLQGPGSSLVVDDIGTGKDRDGAPLLAGEDGFWQREQIGAFTALPLWLDDEPVGALFVNYRTPHIWGIEELATLDTFAAQASVIIQQARIIDLQQKEHRTVEALHHFVRLGSKGKTDMAWEAILKYGLSVTKAQKGRILVWDPLTEGFVSKYQRNFKASEDDCFEDHDNAKCSFIQGVVTKKDPRLIVDTAAEPLPECCQTACRDIRSMLVLPILSLKKKPMGILLLADKQPAALDENDERIMKSIVASVGVTIENITNNQIVQDNNKLLEGLLGAFQDVTTQQDLQVVLQKIADGTCKAMDCDVVTLYTYDESKGGLLLDPTIAGDLYFPEAPYALGYVSRDSVVWKVFEQGKFVYTDDTFRDSTLNNPRARRVGGIDSFVVREKVRASAAVPLKIHNQRVGVLFVNYRSLHHFDNMEINALQIFANEAAVAINDTKLYGQLQRRKAHLEAVYEASKIVTASVDRNTILDSILKQVVEKVLPVHEKMTIAGSLQVFDPEFRELVMESVYPSSEYDNVVRKVNKRLSIVRQPDQPFGITARAALELKPQNVGDVLKDPDYIQYSAATRSELAFPLVDGNTLLGVLDIECEQENAFNDTDIDAIKALAELSIVALRNAETAQEMVRLSSIASMGAWGAELTHEMKDELSNIRRKTNIIDSELRDLPIDDQLRQDLIASILEIEQSVDKLKVPSMPRSSQEAEQFIPDIPARPDELIRRACKEFREKNPEIRYGEELECGQSTARLHEVWFERILRHLLHNASWAVGKRSDPRIFVRSRREEKGIRVEVVDNGIGVTEKFIPLLFREPIPAREERSGHGLLIVRYLLELHGGRIRMGWNKPGQGASFVFTVPYLSGQNGPANGGQTKEQS